MGRFSFIELPRKGIVEPDNFSLDTILLERVLEENGTMDVQLF